MFVGQQFIPNLWHIGMSKDHYKTVFSESVLGQRFIRVVSRCFLRRIVNPLITVFLSQATGWKQLPSFVNFDTQVQNTDGTMRPRSFCGIFILCSAVKVNAFSTIGELIVKTRMQTQVTQTRR